MFIYLLFSSAILHNINIWYVFQLLNIGICSKNKQLLTYTNGLSVLWKVLAGIPECTVNCTESVPRYKTFTKLLILFFFFFDQTNSGYSFGTPQGDQFVPQGMPPPPTTPGTGPLGFAPATTPTQDMSKAPPAQADFSYSQYGE